GRPDYSPGRARIRSVFERQPTLVLADAAELEGGHARDFLAWEARGGDPVCIARASGERDTPPPAGIRYVVTTEGETEAPFTALELVRSQEPYALWERRGHVDGPPPEG